jgi:hypothetical protein
MGSMKMMKVVDEPRAQVQNEMTPMKMIVRGEDENHAQFQYEAGLMKKDDYAAHSQNEVEMKAVMERLPLLLMEETLGDRSSVVFPVKMGTTGKNYTVASEATGEKEKKVSISKVWVGLAPPRNLNAMRAKAHSWSSTSNRPGESNVKIHNQKLD